MIRRSDLSGAKEWSGEIELMCWRMVAREAGWKMWMSSSWVTRSVLEGGEGWDRGGIFCRSIESGEWARCLEKLEGDEEVDVGGEEVAGCWFISVLRCDCGCDCDSDSDCVTIASAMFRQSWSSIVSRCVTTLLWQLPRGPCSVRGAMGWSSA